MGKVKGSSKAADKKRERLDLEKKMNARIALVKAANDVDDLLESLPSFKKYDKKELQVEIIAERVTDLDPITKKGLMDLTTWNMKELYENSHWGWNETRKRKEMFDERAKYLIARSTATDNLGHVIAFAHFRFDMDYDDEVLYVYEIQLEDSVKRKGLGKFMMQLLELLAFKMEMRKIMLTCFRHDEQSQKFFKQGLRYTRDETCPKDTLQEQFDYEILSKPNKRKLAKEEKEKALNEPSKSAMNGENNTNDSSKQILKDVKPLEAIIGA